MATTATKLPDIPESFDEFQESPDAEAWAVHTGDGPPDGPPRYVCPICAQVQRFVGGYPLLPMQVWSHYPRSRIYDGATYGAHRRSVRHAQRRQVFALMQQGWVLRNTAPGVESLLAEDWTEVAGLLLWADEHPEEYAQAVQEGRLPALPETDEDAVQVQRHFDLCRTSRIEVNRFADAAHEAVRQHRCTVRLNSMQLSWRGRLPYHFISPKLKHAGQLWYDMGLAANCSRPMHPGLFVYMEFRKKPAPVQERASASTAPAPAPASAAAPRARARKVYLKRASEPVTVTFGVASLTRSRP